MRGRNSNGSRAHPRVCGENCAVPVEEGEDLGSSPRVRGKHGLTIHTTPCIGLIPACAGKTHSPLTTSYMLTAHPRVCGENLMILVRIGRKAGSSPRVRGKRPRPIQRPHPSGLIPACAGKTWVCGVPSRRSRAHPRVCGENRSQEIRVGDGSGSSPRVRGKRNSHRRRPQRARLIPACAGKTHAHPNHRPSPRAHPRVCGENRVH